MIDKLRIAFEKKDWALVDEFYKILQLITVTQPAVAYEVSSAIKIPEARRKSEASDFTMRSSKPILEKTKTPNKMPAKSKRGKKSTNARKIEFIDTGEAPEDGADKINDNVALTPRKRKPFKPIVMKCFLCGHEDSVAPLFKRDAESYKCNKCLSKGKMNGPE